LKKINDDNIYEIDYTNNKYKKESEVINYGGKRKKVLTDLSLKRLKMTGNDIGQKNDDLIDNEIVNNKKRIATRSQKQKNKEFSYDNNTLNE
jgi:hypothetical protein